MIHNVKLLLLVLLLPPTPWLLAIVVGAWLMRRRPRLARGLILTGALAIWLSCCEATAQLLSTAVLRVPAALTSAEIQTLRQQSAARQDIAVLVLGGGADEYAPEYGGPALKPWTMQRLQYGVWLARRIGAPLGFSGGIGWTARRLKVSEAALAERAAADDFALPLRWAEASSRDTRENAHNSLPILAAAGVHTVVVVTTGMHMSRALRDFRDELPAGMRLVAAPVWLRGDAESEVFDWCPSFHGLERVQYASYEILAWLAGH